MNKLKEVPTDILLRLPNVEFLDISCNWISAIPSEISCLSALQILDASHNQLTHSVPCFPSLRGLVGLKELYVNIDMAILFLFLFLSSIFLKTGLYPSTWHLSRYLNDNKFEAIPEHALKGLPSLNILDISFNRITELPVSLSSFTSLQHLYLDKNSTPLFRLFS